METWTDVTAPGDVWVTDDNTIYVVEQGESGRVSVWSPEGENAESIRRIGGRYLALQGVGSSSRDLRR